MVEDKILEIHEQWRMGESVVSVIPQRMSRCSLPLLSSFPCLDSVDGRGTGYCKGKLGTWEQEEEGPDPHRNWALPNTSCLWRRYCNTHHNVSLEKSCRVPQFTKPLNTPSSSFCTRTLGKQWGINKWEVNDRN